MNALTKHHDRAMDFAELADVARLRKEPVQQQEWLAKALTEELKAVAVCVREKVPEPTFSIVHRSAAALALDCGRNRKAEQLATDGLAGEPPGEIAEELRELLARARSLGAAKSKPAPPPRKSASTFPGVGRGGTESVSLTIRLREGETLEDAVRRLRKRIVRQGPAKEYLLHVIAPLAAPPVRRRSGRPVSRIPLERTAFPQALAGRRTAGPLIAKRRLRSASTAKVSTSAIASPVD